MSIDSQMESHLQTQRQRHLDELLGLLRIPSISALSIHKEDVAIAAAFLAEALTTAGMENVKVFPTEGHPVVYGDYLHAPGKPTVLIYGHYDVQPVDPLNLWDNGPFEPTIKENKIYARGASDDKGPTYLHIKALETILQTTGSLPVNVKFCIEGEEEIGSPHLEPFIATHHDLLQADVLLISDTTIIGPNQPAICYGLRGLCSLEVHVQAAKSDLHSGLFGGAVPNALHAMTELLSSLHDHEGKVLVEGFYDDVAALTAEEREELAKLPQDDTAYMQSLGLNELVGEPGYTTIERTTARPTLELNGVYGGFQGEGSKTVIPAEAHAKITCRLVNNQDPLKILDLIEAHLKAHEPKGVTVTVTRHDHAKPFIADFHQPAIQTAVEAYRFAYDVEPQFMRMGGSIPIVEAFDRLLNLPVVLMGFSLPDENFHAPNEHFSLDNFDKGLRALVFYYTHLERV